ncbi:MAG: hypothetical protein U9N02_08620 [Campylobacterota bacterium]|nr:hypothetical protein [Campylobacterota bacterium]
MKETKKKTSITNLDLEYWFNLKEKDIITEAEYQEKKIKILNK